VTPAKQSSSIGGVVASERFLDQRREQGAWQLARCDLEHFALADVGDRPLGERRASSRRARASVMKATLPRDTSRSCRWRSPGAAFVLVAHLTGAVSLRATGSLSA
jgi:hypothetical protein